MGYIFLKSASEKGNVHAFKATKEEKGEFEVTSRNIIPVCGKKIEIIKEDKEYYFPSDEEAASHALKLGRDFCGSCVGFFYADE